MTLQSTLSGLLFTLSLLTPTFTAAETVEHAGTTYWIYRVAPGKEKVELYLGEQKGEPNTFPKLEARLQKKGRRLK